MWRRPGLHNPHLQAGESMLYCIQDVRRDRLRYDGEACKGHRIQQAQFQKNVSGIFPHASRLYFPL